MTLEYGLLLGVFGTLITIVGMMIAYIVGYKSLNNKVYKNKVPDALKDLLERKYYDEENKKN